MIKGNKLVSCKPRANNVGDMDITSKIQMCLHH